MHLIDHCCLNRHHPLVMKHHPFAFYYQFCLFVPLTNPIHEIPLPHWNTRLKHIHQIPRINSHPWWKRSEHHHHSHNLQQNTNTTIFTSPSTWPTHCNTWPTQAEAHCMMAEALKPMRNVKRSILQPRLSIMKSEDHWPRWVSPRPLCRSSSLQSTLSYHYFQEIWFYTQVSSLNDWWDVCYKV